MVSPFNTMLNEILAQNTQEIENEGGYNCSQMFKDMGVISVVVSERQNAEGKTFKSISFKTAKGFLSFASSRVKVYPTSTCPVGELDINSLHCFEGVSNLNGEPYVRIKGSLKED